VSDDRADRRPYGQVLDAYLADGGVLRPVAAGIDLQPGERCFGIGSGKLVRDDGTETWALVERGLVHVTDRRIVVEGTDGRSEIPLDSVRSVTESPLLVELGLADGERVALVLPYPDYWRVLLERVLAGPGDAESTAPSADHDRTAPSPKGLRVVGAVRRALRHR
jgi:hypothetical protein